MGGESDQDGGGRKPDPEGSDEDPLSIRQVDAPDEERAGETGGRAQQGQEEPEVSGLQRPAAAREPARRASTEPDPPHCHHDRPEHGEPDHEDEQLGHMVSADDRDEGGDRDDQLALTEQRWVGALPGLGQAREQHADRGT